MDAIEKWTARQKNIRMMKKRMKCYPPNFKMVIKSREMRYKMHYFLDLHQISDKLL